MKSKSARAAAALLSLAMLGWAAPAAAQAPVPSYPGGKVVRLIVPFTAGTSLDVVARQLAAYMAQKTGAPFVVENRAGAGGLIGSEFVAKSAADGHTVLVVGQSITTAKMLNRNLTFDPLADLAPVAQIGVNDIVLVTNRQAGVKNLAEFVARTKADPTAWNYATTGRGAVNTLVPELLRMNMGLSLTQVLYKGSAEAITGLLRGDVQLSLHSTSQVLPHMKSGVIQPLVAVADRRLPTMPDVPTLSESGYQGFVPVIWSGLMVPRDTPAAAIRQIEALMAEAAKDPEMIRKASEGAGVNLTGVGADQFRRMLTAEVATWERVIKAANIQPE